MPATSAVIGSTILALLRQELVTSMLRWALATAFVALLGSHAMAQTCPSGFKSAAGACVKSCPAGYEDTGRTCTYRRQGGGGGS